MRGRIWFKERQVLFAKLNGFNRGRDLQRKSCIAIHINHSSYRDLFEWIRFMRTVFGGINVNPGVQLVFVLPRTLRVGTAQVTQDLQSGKDEQGYIPKELLSKERGKVSRGKTGTYLPRCCGMYKVRQGFSGTDR